ncbi:MAG: hypothetical protein PUP91_13740 [Rhizonema sp. PD37]|nr:hypothetical protein [Rhizonema sp. PD37]
MASPFFSGRIPQELFERIEQNIQNTGRTKTEILVAALEIYLSSPQSQIKTDNADIREEIALLRQEFLTQLEEMRVKLPA